LELLEYDLPLSDNEYEIQNLFAQFSEDLENSEVLFPDVFQFYSIKEYHDPIVRFSTLILEKGNVNPKKLASYKKMILTNARLEYKRMASWKAKDITKEDDGYGSDAAPVYDLVNYINLIAPYKKDKAVAELLQKITRLDIDELRLEIARLELVNNKSLDTNTRRKLLENPNTAFLTYQLLNNANELNGETWADDKIADAAIIHFEKIDMKTDSVQLYKKRVVPLGDKSISYFFYKIAPKKPENNYNNFGASENRIAAIAFVNKDSAIDPKAFKLLSGVSILDEDDLEEQYDAIIDESINGNRIRASFGRQNNNYMTNLMEGNY
jgi:hypothetical protein